MSDLLIPPILDDTGQVIVEKLQKIRENLVANEKNFFQPVIYSDEEREIGVWTDGKPLYQKTIEVNTSNGVIYTITNGDTVLVRDIYGIYNASGTLQYLNINAFFTSSDNCLVYTRGSDVYLQITNTFKSSYTKVLMVLQYTKTTDIAGSGQYTTLGVPAVHYSTDEQVIGTWIDGKTLYEKTIDCGNMPNNTTKTISIGNIYPKKIEGCMYNPNDENVTRPLPFSSSSVNDNVRVDTEYQNLRIVTSANWSSYKAYITIQYTKP